MNLTIAKAMLREQFQRTLPILAISLGISTAMCLGHYVSLWWYPSNEEFTGFTMVVAYAIGILGLLYCDSDERNLQMAMPAYLLRLPVRTIDLVIWRMGYGLLFVALIGIWNSAIHYPLLSNEGDPAAVFRVPCLIGITTYALVQSLAWSIGGSGILVLLCAYRPILMLSAYLDFKIDLRPYEAFDPSANTTDASLSVLIALVTSLLISYVGLRTRRSARIDVDRILGALPTLLSRDRGVDLPPFRSPEQAMRWFEWRRQSRQLPMIVCVTSIVIAFFGFKITHDLGFDPSTRAAMLAGYAETVAVAFYFGLGVGALGFGGYCFFQNQRLQLNPLKTFLFIRPVSTKQLGQARIVVVLRSVLISIVPFLLVGSFAILLAIRTTDPTDFSSTVNENIGLGGVGLGICLLLGIFAIIWSFQWLGNLLALLSVMGIGSLVGLVLVLLVDVEVSREEAFITAWAFGLAACVSVAAGAYAFFQAFQSDLVEKNSLYVALAIWPLLAVGFAVLLNSGQYSPGAGSFDLSLHHIGLILALAVLPIAPLATVPLVMQYARHR